jgi:ferredoxin--NADP+ reductase
LDELSQASLADSADRGTVRKIEVLQGYARRQPSGKSRKLIFRFLVSPVELTGDETDQITAMKIVKNKLVRTEMGTLQAKATDEYETLPVGLVFRSIGYKGVPLPGVPFNDKWGVILNQAGRVMNPEKTAVS